MTDDQYDSPPLTLRQLLHELTDEHVMLDEPVHVDGGDGVDCLVTGLSVRLWRGPDGNGPWRSAQSLTFERNRDNR